jgi:predicted component of type VI protein secretion system
VRRLLVLLAVVALVPLLSACVMTTTTQAQAPVMKSVDPGMVGDQTVSPTKKGVAEAEGIILFYFGDNSIQAAMDENNITRIHHVDYETLNVLNIYVKRKTIVYGE